MWLILFDVDGTLLSAKGAALRAMKRAVAALHGEEWNWDGITASGHLDTLIFKEAAALNGLPTEGESYKKHLVAFRDRYLDELTQELQLAESKVVRMPGIPELLENLRDRDDVTLALLTGNFEGAVPLKLEAADIPLDPFRFGVYAEDAEDRPGLVAEAMRRFAAGGFADHELEPRRVVVIGDTVRDVRCAKAHGCVSLSVTTGGGTREQLEAEGSDYVLNDLSDPEPIRALLDGRLLAT